MIELLKKQRDAVRIACFSDKLEVHTPAKSSVAHHRYLYSELEKYLVEYSEKHQKQNDTLQLYILWLNCAINVV
ncbi:MAG: hypothetical protein R2779_05155 [Crocinitomicaceae bacterium]